MDINEINVTIRMYENVENFHVNNEIANLLKKAYGSNEQLIAFHKSFKRKFSSFSNLTPVETKDKTYKRGKVYTFRVRSANKDFLKMLQKELLTTHTQKMVVLAAKLYAFRNDKKTIDSLSVVTPIFIRDRDNPIFTNDIQYIEKLLKSTNTEYSKYLGTHTNIDFIESIELSQGLPHIVYKGNKYFGKKGKIYIKKTDESQDMANFLLNSGIGEGSLGMGLGFVYPNYL